MTLALIATTTALGWTLATHEKQDTTIFALHLVYALYLFLIAARSIPQNSADSHSESILHLTVLITVAFMLLASTAILPTIPSPVPLSIDDESALKGLWYALTCIYGVVAVIAYTTPLGPPLHYPPSDIYSEKTVQSITNTDEDNTCGIISALSPIFLAIS